MILVDLLHGDGDGDDKMLKVSFILSIFLDNLDLD
jgi:hypothetical protein